MKEGSVVQEYFNLLQEYSKKYGEKTTVIYQKGKFYELYGIDNGTEKINNLHDICRNILLIDVTYTDGWKENMNSRSNPQMAGFPLSSINKYVSLLLKHGYTVVEVVEDGDDPVKKCKKRKVKCVHSSTTSQLIGEETDTNLLVSVYVDILNRDMSSLQVAVCSVDLRTGISHAYHLYEVDSSEILANSIEIIHSLSPREIILATSANLSKSPELQDRLYELLELKNFEVNYQYDAKVSGAGYQNSFLSEIYTKTRKQSPLAYIGMDKYPELATSFVYMLRFVREHNSDIVIDLPKPEIHNKSRYLMLFDRTLYHLNMFSNNELAMQRGDKYNSLFSILNETKTPMGKRALRDRLRLPIYNSKRLKFSYKCVSEMIQQDMSVYSEILKNIADTSRLARYMVVNIQNLTPIQFINMHKSFIRITELIELLKETKYLSQLIPSKCTENLKKFMQEYTKVLNVDILKDYHFGREFNANQELFHPNIDSKLDQYCKEIADLENKIQNVLSKIQPLVSGNIKTVFSDISGLVIRVTKKRGIALRKELTKLDALSEHEWSHDSRLKTTEDITSNWLREWSLQQQEYKKKLNTLIETLYSKYMKTWYEKYHKTVNQVCNLVAEVDIMLCFAGISKKYKYVQPHISKNTSKSSYICATGLRNPIIERLKSDTQYIPTDISIGQQDTEKDKTCMLLYGINSSGKSTTLRTVGLSIVMAQIGCFVPADSFTYYPYRKMITKMTNEDNLFMGQSTFVLEMLQLKNMLHCSDSNTLILGDEIASGTETHSAVAILAAAVKDLCQRRISTIFTTHYHELMDLEDISQLSNLDIRHIEIKVSRGELIYNRELKSGSGPSDYGIKIASLLNLKDSFIKEAKRYKSTICDDKSPTVSKYNTELYMKQCAICGRRKDLHTHHIQFQETADQQDMVGSIHKNHKSNLAVLCQRCHKKLHKGKIHIQGYIETENGAKLLYN